MATTKIRWHRYIDYHRTLALLNSFSIILWSFLLAGCTSSNGLRNVYLFSLSYKQGSAHIPIDSLLMNPNITQVLESQISRSARLIQEVRVGYLSLCIAFDSDVWSCSTDARALATLVSEGNGDPLNLLRLAERVRTGTFFYGLIIIALLLIVIAVCLLATVPSWRGEVNSEGSEYDIKPFPSRPRLHSALAISFVSTLLGLASAFWQHIGGAEASSLTRLLTYDVVEAHIGATSAAFGWIAASLTGITTLFLLVSILSMKILSELVD